MFAGFNLTIDDKYEFYYERGRDQFNKNRNKIKKELDDFVFGDGSLDGSKMQESWFPQVKADVFISHSHKDERRAIELAGWLKFRFNIDAFIDSCVWGYAGDLLKIIDDEFCLNSNKETYDYSKRNYSTSHVHMMLSTALSMMIDKTECVIFLNTPNSITASDIINKTESPWIYSELAMTKLVRNRKLEEYRPFMKSIIEKKAYVAEEQQLVVKYNVSLDHLHDLNKVDLELWGRQCAEIEFPLDKLYEIKSLFPVATNLSK